MSDERRTKWEGRRVERSETIENFRVRNSVGRCHAINEMLTKSDPRDDPKDPIRVDAEDERADEDERVATLAKLSPLKQLKGVSGRIPGGEGGAPES